MKQVLDLSKMSLTELKAFQYDQFVELERIQKLVQVIDGVIKRKDSEELNKPKIEPKKNNKGAGNGK